MAKSIPADIKLRRGLEKAVLRDAAKGILPEDLRLRRKSGFMLTSEAVDFFGADRKASEKFQRHLARDAFSRVGVFNYRAFLFVRLLAKIPPYNRLLKQLRRNANKVVMYMLQVHMLHQMFIETPPWADTDGDCSVTKDATSPPEMAVA
jgi:hypothetical protein